ncbi:MAG: hypothetical protein JRI23_19615 [Deltaproteobacteria bacterium]|jgi:hypothetical protein|nr:hypothetical protein [Deltaproteobacteria bacterium]MBW2534074.1 hypothetical protein [Deltaproteobacteria bacterium]
MTNRTQRDELEVLSTEPRGWKQTVFRGVAVAAAILGMAGVTVMAPAASPDTVAAPATKGLYSPVTQSAKAAFLKAMLESGYVIMPAIQLDDASS